MSEQRPTWNVQVVEETGSTNADLLAAAAAGAPDRTVLRALHQTAGRGRLGRVWEAPAGANLLVSFLFRTGLDHPHRVTHRVAVAAALACERVAGVKADLKWPNDLLLGGEKLGGILTQVGGSAGRVEYVVPGLGLNVRWAPPGAACLGDQVDPAAVLDAILLALDELGDDHDAEYRRRLATLGQRVRVELMNGELLGTAIDVLADGRLVVRPDGASPDGTDVVAVDTGDVVHLRPDR
jgi:BirA family biotin operon repressor/biotin-[acetyl-CoA-carboxylase] ligase